MLITQQNVDTRYDILSLLPPGHVVGVEVGTDTGINARELLLSRADLFLWTVDPWLATADFTEVGRGTALKFYEERVGEFVRASRTKHLRMTSVRAAQQLNHDGVVPDFIYIDGEHSEKAVKEDLEAWWPLLRSGGMMAGHDFDTYDGCVAKPVIKFAKRNRLDLRLINEHGTLPDMGAGPGTGFDKWGGWSHVSFFFFKP